MYYSVGSWKDYIFVYNSSDCSCRMITKNSLEKMDIMVEELSYRLSDMNRLCSLYNFMSREDIFIRGFCSYVLPISSDILSSVSVHLFLCLIPRLVIKSPVNKSIYNACGKGDYVPFLGVYTEYVTRFRDCRLQDIVLNNGSGRLRGIIIPEFMLNYLMVLHNQQNLSGVVGALDNLVTSGFVIDIKGKKFFMDRYKSITDINWKVI